MIVESVRPLYLPGTLVIAFYGEKVEGTDARMLMDILKGLLGGNQNTQKEEETVSVVLSQ